MPGTHHYPLHSHASLSLVLGLVLASLLPTLAAAIAIDAENPWYWNHRGKPVMLIGGSNNDNLFQSPDFVEQFDTLQTIGGNYVRCTMSSRDDGDLWPFAKADDGRYDLNAFNPEYWGRFERFLDEADKRDIIVQVEVWATFDFYRENWERNPFNPKNNRNLTPGRVRLAEIIPTHPVFRENEFFWSVPEMDNNTQLLGFQQGFVHKLLSVALEHDNVLYCIDNETSVTASWAIFWARYISDEARLRGKTAHVTEMWDPHDLSHATHRVNLHHPEVFSFIDVSQNNHKTGQEHYDNGLAYRHKVAVLAGPRPLTNVKIYGNERYGTPVDAVERFWRNAFMGFASVRFHRPDSGIGLDERAQTNIRSLRTVFDAVAFHRFAPAPEWLVDPPPNTAFVLAREDAEWLVYFPSGGEAAAPLPADHSFDLRWMRIEDGAWRPADTIRTESEPTMLRPPAPGTGWVAWISAAGGS